MARAHRQARRRPDRGRLDAADGHRRDPRRRPPLPAGEAGPRHPHRDVLRRRGRAVRERGRHRARPRRSTAARSSPPSCSARRRRFDFLDNNPFVEFHPTEYVNDPFVIAQNDKMVAINSAHRRSTSPARSAPTRSGRTIYSGFGGQVDFIRGAARSRGGQADHRPALHGEGRRASPASWTTLSRGRGGGHHAGPTSTTS